MATAAKEASPNLTQLIVENGIRQLVYVPASDLLPKAEFHAWPFDVFHSSGMGVGATAEEAIRNAASRRMARAA